MASVGLVITFIGLGERGFKTVELKLIGASLVGCGLILALLRIFYFCVPSGEKEEDSEKLMQKEEDLNIFDEPDVDSFHDVAPWPRHTIQDQISSRPAVHPAWKEDATDSLGYRQQLAARTMQEDGSTKDLQAFEIFLNSQRLFTNKK